MGIDEVLELNKNLTTFFFAVLKNNFFSDILIVLFNFVLRVIQPVLSIKLLSSWTSSQYDYFVNFVTVSLYHYSVHFILGVYVPLTNKIEENQFLLSVLLSVCLNI